MSTFSPFSSSPTAAYAACGYYRAMTGLLLSMLIAIASSTVNQPRAAAAPGAAARARVVVTTDGQVVTGIASRQGKAIIINDGVRKVYLSPAIVRSNDPVPAPEAMPVYELNTERVKNAARKGTLGLVLKNPRFSRVDGNGEIVLSCEDFKLGKVQTTLVPVRLTPQGIDYAGLEYAYTISFSNRADLACRLASNQTDNKDPAALLKLAKFNLLAGKTLWAAQVLRQLEQIAPDHPDLAAEHTAQAEEGIRLQLAELRRLELSGNKAMWVKSSVQLAKAELPPALKEPVEKVLKESAAATAALKLANNHLAASGLKGNLVDPGAAQQLVRILKLDTTTPRTAPPKVLERLTERWAAALAEVDFDEKTLNEAVSLADKTADYYAADDAKAAKQLGRVYETSNLPTALKLSILQWAAKFPAPGKNWQKIEYKHPDSGKTYHYYVQVPPNYRPDKPTPAMLSLHGQTTMADVMRLFWGGAASKWGLILISPEYIYGRASGYKRSTEEHEAVLGALWHASNSLNIDHDRVYLQGHSQGGHATWDIGPAHAGVFAGIVPLLGVPLETSLTNMKDTALYSVDGSLDGSAPARNRKAIAELAQLGCDARYVEYINRKHEAFYEEYDAIAQWMLSHRRDTARAKLNLVPRRKIDGQRHWLRITRSTMDGAGASVFRDPGVVIDASFKNNVFIIRSRNVAAMEVLINPAMVDLAKPVRVTANGRTGVKKLSIDWEFALSDTLKRRDRQEVFVEKISIRLNR